MDATTRVLAIDPSLSTGWCWRQGRDIHSGVWKLHTNPRFDSVGMRWLRFCAKLDEIYRMYGVDRVVYEEVRFHRGAAATQVYEGLVSHLQSWCERKLIPYEGVCVKTLKKFACGNGNADKHAMIGAAQARFPAITVADDNEADALLLAAYVCGDTAAPDTTKKRRKSAAGA